MKVSNNQQELQHQHQVLVTAVFHTVQLRQQKEIGCAKSNFPSNDDDGVWPDFHGQS